MNPVTISRTKIHTGLVFFDLCLDPFSRGLCFVLTPAWVLLSGAAPTPIYIIEACYQYIFKSLTYTCFNHDFDTTEEVSKF